MIVFAYTMGIRYIEILKPLGTRVLSIEIHVARRPNEGTCAAVALAHLLRCCQDCQYRANALIACCLDAPQPRVGRRGGAAPAGHDCLQVCVGGELADTADRLLVVVAQGPNGRGRHSLHTQHIHHRRRRGYPSRRAASRGFSAPPARGLATVVPLRGVGRVHEAGQHGLDESGAAKDESLVLVEERQVAQEQSSRGAHLEVAPLPYHVFDEFHQSVVPVPRPGVSERRLAVSGHGDVAHHFEDGELVVVARGVGGLAPLQGCQPLDALGVEGGCRRREGRGMEGRRWRAGKGRRAESGMEGEARSGGRWDTC